LSGQHGLLYFFASMTYVFIASLLGYGVYKMRTKSPNELENSKMKVKYGGFYTDYKVEQKYFFLVSNSQKILSAVFLASLTGIAWAQIGMLMAVRISFVLALVYFSPHQDKFTLKMNILMTIMKLFQIFIMMLIVGGVASGKLGIFLLVINALGVLFFIAIYLNKVLCQARVVKKRVAVQSTALGDEEVANPSGLISRPNKDIDTVSDLNTLEMPQSSTQQVQTVETSALASTAGNQDRPTGPSVDMPTGTQDANSRLTGPSVAVETI
jgi:hypothetical protein